MIKAKNKKVKKLHFNVERIIASNFIGLINVSDGVVVTNPRKKRVLLIRYKNDPDTKLAIHKTKNGLHYCDVNEKDLFNLKGIQEVIYKGLDFKKQGGSKK